MDDYDFICGYHKMKSLYDVEKYKLNPAYLLITSSYMLYNNIEKYNPKKGILETEKDVVGNLDFSIRWLFLDDFHVDNTYKKTKLQC